MMRSQSKLVALAWGMVLFAGAVVAATVPAEAAKRTPRPATYVGIWGETTAQCRQRIPVRGPNSPVRFTTRGYDQWEQHCALSSIRFVGGTWVMNARCNQVGGPSFNDKATIWATATRLTVKWQSERQRLNYLRCR
jgi:hypothetical protein